MTSASGLTVERARAAPAALVRAIPAWAWLAGLVALSALVRYGLGRRIVAPWIVVDELVYSELARGLAATGSFLVRDEPVGLGFGAVYPLLISPAYLIESLPAAYAAAKAINALLISLAAVPAYLLARRVVAPVPALVVAVLTIAVPSVFYAGTIMSENAFYPVFLLAALALARALEQPTWLRSGLLLAALALAFLTRVQAVVLVAATATAPLLLALWERRAGELRRHVPLYGTLAAAAALVLVGSALRGRSPAELLGAYRAASDRDYDLQEVARWVLYHVAELDLYVGVAPFAALLLLLAIGGRLDAAARVLVAVAGSVTAWLVLQVGAFASLPFVLRIEERNMFYVAPLLFTCLVLWIDRGAPRPVVRTALACAAAAALPALIPFERLINTSATSDTLALIALWDLAEATRLGFDELWLVLLVAGAVVVALLALLPRRLLLALPLLVLVVYAAAAQPVEARMRDASVGALFQGIARPERDWVDEAAGADANVAVLWTGRTDRFTVIQNEFFSRAVRRVYHLAEPVPGALAQSPASVDRGDGLLRAGDGSTIDAGYLLTDDSLPIAAAVAARDARRGIRLYRLSGPARVSSITDGVYADGWAGRAFEYTGFRCGSGFAVARLASDPGLFVRPQTVTAFVGGRRRGSVEVPPTGEEVRWRVPVEAGDRCTIRFVVERTAVPAEVRPGSDDTRALGVRVLSIER